MKLIAAFCFAGVAAIAATRGDAAEGFQIEEATIAGIQQAFHSKSLTCHQLVQAYLDRIAAYDHNGPALDAILTPNVNVLAEADRRDADYARSGPVGPLHCIPLVLKDNYGTADLPTTGGSAALAGAQPQADAFVVARLRKAGAIILAKSNMHGFERRHRSRSRRKSCRSRYRQRHGQFHTIAGLGEWVGRHPTDQGTLEPGGRHAGI
jgi:hypothetical protein